MAFAGAHKLWRVVEDRCEARLVGWVLLGAARGGCEGVAFGGLCWSKEAKDGLTGWEGIGQSCVGAHRCRRHGLEVVLRRGEASRAVTLLSCTVGTLLKYDLFDWILNSRGIDPNFFV